MGKLNIEKYHRLLEIVDVDQTGHVTYRKNGNPVPVHEDRGHYLRGKVLDVEANKILSFTVHRLVAIRWLGDPPEGKDQVSHLDESRHNNCAENLVWASAKENSNMPLRRKRISAALPFAKMSASHKRLKKKVAQYSLKGEFIAEYQSVSAAARSIGGNSGGVSDCCSGRRQTAYGYVWKFA